MKTKQIYKCKECGFESGKWLGKCPNCEAWSSFAEDEIRTGSISNTPRKVSAKQVSPLKFSSNSNTRLNSNIEEFNRVMGGGIVPDSLTLLSGEPGIGKSTLTLQIANNLAKDHKTLLISGEESIDQIAQRNERLGNKGDHLSAINESNLETILETIKNERPTCAIIDSIQVISSLDIPSQAGSISQVRYCTEKIMELAKTYCIATILIGHVTKDGNLAGPRVLEHLVDTVLHLEGDRFQQFRMLRAQKNRFGACNEVGIFEMKNEGLIAVTNPSAQFLNGRKENAIGSAITVAMEGTRPFLVEVQALTSTSPFGYPKRTANGFDLNRLQILIAVLEKHGHIRLQDQDVFVNIVGGIRLQEPAADLAVLMAISSSFRKKPLPQLSAIFGEVGLTGELRKVTHEEKRQKEAQKLGFKNTINSEKLKEIGAALKLIS
ncbi:DNA repair protein RadA [Patescibacteria group bacterium]|nr:DNA repair protein RadA [Patescibacteria group bacterium]